MASFTDTQLPRFRDYVPQLPVQAMVQVGMAKQQKYEENVTKIQGQIDQIAGLDIYRDVDRVYLQSKLNELGNNLKSVAAGDFSNFQLVNSVSGMTSQVAKDKNVQNAVQSTAWYREQRKKIQKDIDEGKSDPSNIYKFDKEANSWINSTTPGELFRGQYVPHFDVFKFAKETFDAVKPDEFTFDQIYQLGADGKPLTDSKGNLILSPAMTRMEKEGRFPEKVKTTLAQIFSDPRVAQQLQITGEYEYKDFDEKTLSNKVLSQKETLLQSYNDQLLELNMQKNLGKDVQAQIDKLESNISNLNVFYDTYSKLAYKNPDAVRGNLYKDDVTSRYTVMFGHVKDKKTILENPRWRAEFDMQKEANEQSRFAQRLKFDMDKEANDNLWKQKEFDQKERLAKLAAENKDKKSEEYGDKTGPGGQVPEQGNQFADFDKIKMFESDYQKAVDTFINSSDRFIWETTGINTPNNIAIKNQLMKSGKTEDEAIHIVLNKIARATGESPEDWRARWGEKAATAYQNMSDPQKQKNPSITAAYNTYKIQRRNFDNQRAIKKSIEDETIRQVGNAASFTKLTDDLPSEVEITYNNGKLKVTKDDIYDMAVYLRGYKSSLGFLNDQGARTAAKAAYNRLRARGKEELADDVLTAEGVFGGGIKGPITRIVRGGQFALSDWFSGGTSPIRGVSMNQFSAGQIWGLVNNTFNKIDNEDYTQGLKKKAEIIDRAYGMKPNLKVGLLTGNLETDRNTVYNLQRMAGEYSTREGKKMNISADFEKFAENLDADPTKNILDAQVIIDAEGNPQIEINSYDLATKKRIGGMTIQPDEALKYNININNLYEPREISLLRNYINYNGGQTSTNPIKERSTYTSGDSYFDNSDFPKLQNTKYKAQANIKYSNGMYFPYIYVTDGTRKINPRELPGVADLQTAVLLIKEIDPTFAEKLLIEK